MMGVVSVQGMCPHEINLGTCTCILKIINAREGGVGVNYGVVVGQGMCPHEGVPYKLTRK